MSEVDRYITGLVNNLENLKGTLSSPANISGKLSNAALRGVAVELRIEGTILQWKYEDKDEWQDLIDLSTLDYSTLQNLPTIDGVEIKGEIAEMIISAIQDLLDEKVDKVQGKELSTNDFTNELKNKLDDIENNAQENVIETIKLNGVTQTIEDKIVDLTVSTFDLSDRIAKGGSMKSVIVGDIDNNIASGPYSYAEGRTTTASGQYSHAENNATATGESSHAEGYGTASGTISHAENSGRAQGSNSHAENVGWAVGSYSHAEGNGSKSSGEASHAEGRTTHADGNYSHTEGYNTQTTNDAAFGHAEGYYTKAMQSAAHAEGNKTEASGYYSHTEGSWTNATHRSQHVFGEYNLLDESTKRQDQRGTYVEIVGNGTSINNRSNIRTLDWDGNQILAGKLTVGVAPTESMDVTTKGYVDTNISNVSDAIPTNVSDLQNDANYIDASGAPVQSVNNQTGDIVITAQSIGALTQHQDISGKADKSELSSVATSGSYNDLTNKPTIPSNVSELNNDSGYLTAETDPTVPAWAKAQTKPTYTANEVGALPSNTYIPNKVSDLTNDENYQTDADVSAAIADAISQITGFDFEIVQQLPASGEKGIIYLIAHSHGVNDGYDEYIWVVDKFERLGNLDIDLSGYLQTSNIISNAEIDQMFPT